MSVRYVAVTWTRQKRIYDAMLALGVVAVVGGFAGATLAVHPDATVETALIRGFGFAGFLLLNLILAIGPLARLDRRFLPLLYNRRHLGVTLGLIGLAHAGFALFQYHALGDINPLVSLFGSNTDWSSPSNYPFELFGVVALAILFLMAATSHDYWLSVLTPPVWKRLHMLVYVAYVALLAHIGLGFLQDQRHPLYTAVLAGSALMVGGLHLAAAARERRRDQLPVPAADWIDVGPASAIAEGRARIGVVAGERVAVFRNLDRLSCVSNVCKHQNGPLGEGRIIDGCITCPWHGYQYLPDSGTSPPPFHDSVPTFNLAVVAGRVLIDPVPNPAGTRVEPVPAPTAESADPTDFYVGYHPAAPKPIAKFVRLSIVTLLFLATSLAVMLAWAQDGYVPSHFEYGSSTTVEGVLRTNPYPALEVARPGISTPSHYLLAAAGKWGAQRAVAGLEGRRVRISGALAYRDALTLVEVSTLLAVDSTVTPAGTIEDLGTFDLVGEIVDSKCYMGVMNPGQGKTHRACAARCLSGGMTPLLAVRGSDGVTREMVLLNEAGGPVPGLGAWAGRPVSIRGLVQRLDGVWLVRILGTVEPAP